MLAVGGCLAALAPASAGARAGDLDPAFSGDGVAQFPIGRATAPGEFRSGPDVAPIGFEPDGDVIVAGSTIYRSNCGHLGCFNSHSYLAMARVRPDGELETSFGDGGVVEDDLSLGGVYTHLFAVQPDGRILAVADPDDDPIVARFTADGRLDPTFSDDGLARIAIPNGQQIYAIGVDDDGRIVIGGWTEGEQAPGYGFLERDYLLVRLLPDGSLDSGFGNGGVAVADYTLGDEVRQLAFDHEDRIVVTGHAEDTAPFGLDLGVARFTPEGQPDTSFGGDGNVELDLLPGRASNEEAAGFGIAPGDRPALMATAFPGDPARGEFYTVDLVRFTSSGDLDSTLGSDGIQEIDGLSESGGWMTVLEDGRMLIETGYGRELLLGRVLADSGMDPAFGEGGWVSVYPHTGAFRSIPLVDPNGRILVGGASLESPARAQVARFRGDDLPPADRDADGVLDPGDRCPGIYEPGEGCPSDTMHVQLIRRDDSIGGKITSTSSWCLTADVLVFRERPGRDLRIARWRADDSALYEPFQSPGRSAWGKKTPPGDGLIYARIRPHFDPTIGDCGGDRSKAITLR
jgi:uncharacterized delta-60 repeat protein